MALETSQSSPSFPQRQLYRLRDRMTYPLSQSSLRSLSYQELMERPALGSPRAFPTRAPPNPIIASRGRAMTPLHEQPASRPRRIASRVFSVFWLALALAAVVLA